MPHKKITALVGLLISQISLAGPADYVSEPSVEQGEKEIEFKYGKARQPDGAWHQSASLGIGYGFNNWWFSEIELKYEKNPGESGQLEAVEWENKFQLTETGKYAVDAGLLAELEIPRNHAHPYEVKFGPLLQTEIGAVQLNGNLLVERKFRGEADPGETPHATEMLYQWQIKHRWKPTFEYGLQGFGEMGKWNDWSSREQQNHRIGPAMFGKLNLGNHHILCYNAAWLFGASQAAPSHTVRLQMEYEF